MHGISCPGPTVQRLESHRIILKEQQWTSIMIVSVKKAHFHMPEPLHIGSISSLLKKWVFIFRTRVNQLKE